MVDPESIASGTVPSEITFIGMQKTPRVGPPGILQDSEILCAVKRLPGFINQVLARVEIADQKTAAFLKARRKRQELIAPEKFLHPFPRKVDAAYIEPFCSRDDDTLLVRLRQGERHREFLYWTARHDKYRVGVTLGLAVDVVLKTSLPQLRHKSRPGGVAPVFGQHQNVRRLLLHDAQDLCVAVATTMLNVE